MKALTVSALPALQRVKQGALGPQRGAAAMLASPSFLGCTHYWFAWLGFLESLVTVCNTVTVPTPVNLRSL